MYKPGEAIPSPIKPGVDNNKAAPPRATIPKFSPAYLRPSTSPFKKSLISLPLLPFTFLVLSEDLEILSPALSIPFVAVVGTLGIPLVPPNFWGIMDLAEVNAVFPISFNTL